MPSALLRRDAVVRAGGYREVDYLEDAGLLERLRLVLRAHVATLPGCGWYVMRRHGANVTLAHGESNAAYLACGLRSPAVRAQQAALDAVRAGPGGTDVVGWTP
jgi:hypothetical protein